MKTLFFSFAIGALSASTYLSAAVINVPGDQATVQAAVNAAGVSGDEIVIAPGTYVGGVLVNQKSLIIRGSDPGNRPVLALSQVGTVPGGGSALAGMNISGDLVNVTVQDLILIPNTASIPNRLIQASTNSAASTITLALTNLLLTGNNGSNAPSVTNPFDTATPIGTATTSDHLYLVNRAFGAGLFDATGIYTLTNVVSIGAGREGITAYPNGGGEVGGSLTASGVKVARVVRNPLQWGTGTTAIGSDFTITGTRANPGLLIVNNTGTPSVAGVAMINDARTVTIDHLAYLNNSMTFYISGDADSVTVDNSLIANTPAGFDGVAITYTGTPGPVTISNTTFFNNGAVASSTGGLWLQATAPTYSVFNNVFAGTTSQTGLFYSAGTGAQTTLNNNALVLAGPHALLQAEAGTGAPAASQTGNVNGNVGFTSTVVSSLADLTTAFDVTASFLAGAGVAGSDITGWGDLVAAPNAADDWSLYQ